LPDFAQRNSGDFVPLQAMSRHTGTGSA